MLRRLEKQLLRKKKQSEKILAPVQGQGHAQVEEKENVHVTRKGGSAVGLSPLLHVRDPGHAPNRGLAVGKDEDVLGLAHLAGYLRSTERDGHHIDVGGRHLQEDVRHQGEEHHQGEDLVLVLRAGSHVDPHPLTGGRALNQLRHAHGHAL